MWSLCLCTIFVGISLPLVNATALRRDVIRTMLASAQWAKNTTVEFPGSDSFVDATERWSIFDEPTYASAISPATEADVVQAVKIATSNGIPFLATGARHGYTTTLEGVENGLAIDLSQFDGVDVDASTGIMRVGGGVRINQIYDPVYNAGYELQVGTASCPGLVGLTLGAGVGPWAGVHGFLLDALLSYRVVTANGSVLDVSESSNQDLFWALRGAGANFGIVVSATYQLQPQLNNGEVLVADIIVPAEKNASYFELLQSYDGGKLPENLSISSFMVWNATVGAPQVTASWAYLGPEDEGRKIFKAMFDLDPIIGAVQVYPYNKVIKSVAGGADAHLCLGGAIHDIYTINARNLSSMAYKTVFEEVSAFFIRHPTSQASTIQIAIHPNNAALATPDDATAYPWRDTIAYIDIDFTWDNSTDLEAAASQAGVEWRTKLAGTSGYPDLAAYINSAHGDESLESRYGARKLPRLAALKAIWDPSNVFRFNNPLPTSYP
ncbi:FAD-binding domain-containing protein [Xylariaceae sp. FL0662B]|nr:FAD-binding domain-containing protein [Xylariaceae sp. FL0662B]